MTATSTPDTRTSTPGNCGCGCGSSSGCGCGSSSGCGCGPASALAATGNFRRPRFFAGQLLTEDDLGLLEDYVVGKNRLHNRHLFGDGVVCGLRVFCHDCDRGKVTVEPGYALDCCGNDLVVPCAEEVDVLALIEELRLEHGGAGCGDPCAVAGEGTRDGVTRHYCLYLNYAEQLEEPVAPYATDQSCDGPCEPSRIVEGYRYELRCGPHEPVTRPDVLTTIRQCIGDLPDLGVQTGRMLDHQRVGTSLTHAQAALAADIPYQFDTASADRLRQAGEDLDAFDLGSADTAVDTSYRLVETVRLFRQNLALAVDATAAEREAADLSDDELAGLSAQLADKMERIPADRVLARVVVHDRASAGAVLRLSDPGADEYQTRLSATMMKAGLAFDSRSRRDYSDSLERLREWLLLRLEKSGTVTSCRLRDEVLAIRVDSSVDVGSEAWARAFGRAAKRLAEAVFDYLIDCICAALNPPCPTCEDEGVLLACLEVEDCEVVDICNQVRTNVLAPTAFRYWFATPIHLVSQAIEFLCCEFGLRLEDPAPIAQTDIDGGTVYVPVDYDHYVAPSTSTATAVSDRLGLSGDSVVAVDAVIGGYQRTSAASGAPVLEALGLRQLAAPFDTSMLAVPAVRSATDSALSGSVRRALDDRPVDEQLVTTVADRVTETAIRPAIEDLDRVRNQVNGFRGQNTRLRNDMEERLEAVTSQLEATQARLAELEQRLGSDD